MAFLLFIYEKNFYSFKNSELAGIGAVSTAPPVVPSVRAELALPGSEQIIKMKTKMASIMNIITSLRFFMSIPPTVVNNGLSQRNPQLI